MASSNHGEGIAAQDLTQKVGNDVHIVGYAVTTMDTYTKNRTFMHFGTFVYFHGNFFDTVHFPEIARKYLFRGRGFYSLYGKVVEDFGITMTEVARMEKLPMINKRAEEFMCGNIEFNGRASQQA